jgi:N-methylhydantoinase A
VVLVPPGPGVAAALGMLVSDLRHDYRATHLQPLLSASVKKLADIFNDFAESAHTTLAGEGVPAERVRLERYLDMRYIGQSWKLSVPLSLDDLTDDAALMRVKSAFDRLHEATYSYSAPDDQVEIVNVGMLATGLMPRIELRTVPSGDRSPCAAHTGTRPVYFGEVGGFVLSEVYDRYALRVGNLVEGPAIVEEVDSTTVVHPGYEAEVAQFGVMMLRRAAG